MRHKLLNAVAIVFAIKKCLDEFVFQKKLLGELPENQIFYSRNLFNSFLSYVSFL